MTDPQPSSESTSDDDAWLEALAGRATPSLGTQDLKEVEHLRKAWATRKQRIEANVPEVDGVFLQRLIDRRSEERQLNVETLATSSETRPDIHAVGHELQRGQVPPNKRTAANSSYIMWGVAASLMLFAVLVVPISKDRDEDGTQTPRGVTSIVPNLRIVSDTQGRRVSVASSHILIEVADREKERNDILRSATELKIAVTATQSSNGNYEIKVPATLAGTELLYRITPVLPDQGGAVLILITLPNK